MKGIDISYPGILRVAIPISIGSFVQFLVVITDNYFLGKVHMNAMNGAGNAALLYVTLLMFAIGLTSAIQIIVARKKGMQTLPEAGEVLANGLALMTVMGLILFAALYTVNAWLLPQLINSPDVLENMREFLSIRSFGLIFYPLTLACIAFYAGIARTWVMLFTTLLTAGTNIILDWGLIFGHFTPEPMGIKGAAWATLAGEFVSLLFIGIYIFWDKKNKDYRIANAFKINPLKHMKPILKIGLPISFQQMVALATWTVFFFLIEKLGEQELQSSHIVRSMYMLAFVSIMGISQSTKTFVSTLIAENRQKELWLVIRRLIGLNLLGVLILTHGLWVYPNLIGEQFSSDVEVIELTRKSLFVIMPALIISCASSVFINAVEGAGKTMVALGIEIIAVISYLGLTAWMTIGSPQPIYIVWMNDYVYFGLLGLLGGLFLRFGNWKFARI